MKPAATPEALAKALEAILSDENHAIDWGNVVERMIAGPLAPVLADLQRVTAEKRSVCLDALAAQDQAAENDERARKAEAALATATAEAASLRVEIDARQAADVALLLSNDGELEADPQKQIAHLQLSCREFIREREEWKASAKREWAVVDRLRVEVEALNDALDNSQSLLATVHHVGPDRSFWDAESLTTQIVEQICENRVVLDRTVIRPQRSGPPFSMAFEPGGRIDVEEATQA